MSRSFGRLEWDASVKNRQEAINRKPTALIEIVRLLARQAAREWTERLPEADHSAPAHPRSEKPS